MEKLAYIISPVRQIDDKLRRRIVKYVSELEASGYKVFDPIRNAPQEDKTGYNIVISELKFLKDIATTKRLGIETRIPVFWDSRSEGLKVDMGMLLGLRLTPDLIEEENEGWEDFIALGTRMEKAFSKRPGRRGINLFWDINATGIKRDVQSVKLGLTLSSIRRFGGINIKSINLKGDDDPTIKSYPKVIKEIMNKQSSNTPLW